MYILYYTFHHSHLSYPNDLIVVEIVSIAWFNNSIPKSLSRVTQVMTYIGGAMSLILMGFSGDPRRSPASNAYKNNIIYNIYTCYIYKCVMKRTYIWREI